MFHYVLCTTVLTFVFFIATISNRGINCRTLHFKFYSHAVDAPCGHSGRCSADVSLRCFDTRTLHIDGKKQPNSSSLIIHTHSHTDACWSDPQEQDGVQCLAQGNFSMWTGDATMLPPPPDL